MGLFSKTKTTQLQDLRSEQAKALGEQFLGTLQESTAGFKPGADFGPTSVDLTEFERQGLGQLGEFIEGDVRESDLFRAGRKQISDTLEGTTFDPTTGEFFKGTRAAIQAQEQEAIDRARRGQAVRGAFRSTGGLRQEGDILSESNIATQQLLGGIAERERERQAIAGGQALKLAEFESRIPLTKAQAAFQFGSLERENQIQNLEREYDKWRNQRSELMSAFTQAGQASNFGQPLLGVSSFKTTSPTLLGELTDLGLQIGSLFAGKGAKKVSKSGTDTAGNISTAV